jgi:hypothetical protein
MCAECGCYGSVNPYGVGGREVSSKPTEASLKKVTVIPGAYHKDTSLETEDYD